MPISRSCMRRSRTRSKKGLSPDEKRDVVRHMHEAHGVSIRQGCQAASLPRSTYRYERRERDDSDVITALSELVEQKPGIGFWQALIGCVGLVPAGITSGSTGSTPPCN